MADKTRFRSTFYYEGRRYETTGKDQKEADQKAAIKQDKLKRGEVGISANMTVKRWAEEWLETYKRPTVGDAQYKIYLSLINRVIVPEIGGLRLRDVKDIHLQKILNSRVGNSRSHVSKLKNTLNAIFAKAYQSRLVSRNPAEALEMPAANDGTHRSITDIERRHIIELSGSHHAGLWIMVMLYSGLRPGETRALDWRHVDFEKKLIHVEQAMKAGTRDIGQPKSSAGIRDIPIHKDLLPLLEAARQSRLTPCSIN